jgi:hypothetical protein
MANYLVFVSLLYFMIDREDAPNIVYCEVDESGYIVDVWLDEDKAYQYLESKDNRGIR